VAVCSNNATIQKYKILCSTSVMCDLSYTSVSRRRNILVILHPQSLQFTCSVKVYNNSEEDLMEKRGYSALVI